MRCLGTCVCGVVLAAGFFEAYPSQAEERSLAVRQIEAMIAEKTEGLSPAEATARRDALMAQANPVLQDYYSEPHKICVTLDGKVVSTLPCERVPFEYPQQDRLDPSHRQAGPRGQANVARTQDGDIWAHIKSDGAGPVLEGRYSRPIFHSGDGGRTWSWTVGSSSTGANDFAFTILQDDTFFVAGTPLAVNASPSLRQQGEDVGADSNDTAHCALYLRRGRCFSDNPAL